MDSTNLRREDRAAYWHGIDWLTAAVHELPAGILDGTISATIPQCHAMLEQLEDFRRLCERLELDDHRDFINDCRWHFEHYAHYLERRPHFANYEKYTLDRHGPPRVTPPPPAPHWLRR